MAAPIDDKWSGNELSDSTLDQTTIGMKGSNPTNFPQYRPYIRTDLGEWYYNTGTYGTPTYSAMTLALASLKNSGGAAQDILRWDGTNWVRLAIGSSGTYLKSNGSGSAPSWGSPLTTKSVLSSELASDYTLTTSFADTGLSVTLPSSGSYHATFSGTVTVPSGSDAQVAFYDGSLKNPIGAYQGGSLGVTLYFPISDTCSGTCSGQTLKIQAKYSAGSAGTLKGTGGTGASYSKLHVITIS